jgi:Uma2 family endonuclease
MAVLTRELTPQPVPQVASLPLLVNGDHLDQPTYHALYERTPEGFKAELIGGIVFVASPTGRPHMRWGYNLTGWLSTYEDETPGVEGLDSGTFILGPKDEPEPDISMRIPPQLGGRTQDVGDYIHGAPELVIEVAYSSAAIDLHLKKERYLKAGADEYLVLDIHSRQPHWFALEAGEYVEIAPDPDGVLRSRRFPGLWLDAEALFKGDRARVAAVVREGCATPEHDAFAASLALAAQHP